MDITKLNTKGLFKSHLDFSGKISLYILARPSQKPFTAYQSSVLLKDTGHSLKAGRIHGPVYSPLDLP